MCWEGCREGVPAVEEGQVHQEEGTASAGLRAWEIRGLSGSVSDPWCEGGRPGRVSVLFLHGDWNQTGSRGQVRTTVPRQD